MASERPGDVAAKAAGALTLADNTLLTPLRQQPLALGCDLVLHSTTKAINGHGDLFGGALLAADPALSYEILAPDAWSDAIAAKFDVVILDDFVPSPQPASNLFYVKRSPFDGGAMLEQPVLTEIDGAHPTLRLLDFAQTTILRAQPLTLPPPDTEWTYAAPLRSFDHALLVVGEQRERHGRNRPWFGKVAPGTMPE